MCLGAIGTTGLAQGVDSSSGTFSDDDGNVHEGYIEAIAAVGITKGCNPPENSRYCPADALTRGQLAAILRRALELPPAVSTFTDDDDSQFEADIAALAAAGITHGCNPPANTMYCANEVVTRGQIAAFLVRALGFDVVAGEDWFVDDDNSIFETDIDSLRAAGITKGCNPPANTMYCPGAAVRRDQMASLLGRALGLSPITSLAPPPAATTTTSAATTTTTTIDPMTDPVLIGAGDIANEDSIDDVTAALVMAFPDAVVYTTGDNAYPDGTAEDFALRYDPSWGAFKDRTRPSIGNHDDHTEGAVAYFDYFGANAGTPGEGWYSYDLGDWHVIVLNSECGDAGFASCDDQRAWLESDLTANTQTCSLAYWHKPLFNAGLHAPGSESLIDEWALLDAAGVEFVINGHDHNYQRYARQDSDGVATSTGMREFVVGTGGAGLYDKTMDLPNLEEFHAGHGVLKLDLGATGYTWTFLSIDGAYTDTGADTC